MIFGIFGAFRPFGTFETFLHFGHLRHLEQFSAITTLILMFKSRIQNVATIDFKHPMLVQCWATVRDAGPSLKHYWIYICILIITPW